MERADRMSLPSGVSSGQVSRIDISPAWKKNESLPRELEESEMPSSSRLVYKEITHETDSNNQVRINYDLANIYDNRKHLFGIAAELSCDLSSVIREEIAAGSTRSLTPKGLLSTAAG